MSNAQSVWPYEIQNLSRADIQRVIKCEEWQQLRMYLKGKSTMTKLRMSLSFYDTEPDTQRCDCTLADHRMIIDNYLNALLRGGQLVRDNGSIRINR